EEVGAIYGSNIASGIFVELVSRVFSKIKILLPRLVTGTVITVFGLTLIPLAIEKMGGGNATAVVFGHITNVLLDFVTNLLSLGVQLSAKCSIPSNEGKYV
ncbi:solute carrier family 23 protein, partial [Enterococcus faecium]|uniref:solute carrier family 23 protein n=1 Tax=Enterococcus faecium TaxID=1352 RepID=UPI000E069138